MEKSAHIEVWGSPKAYTWFNLNFTDQGSLFCGLSDMRCTSALAIEEGNAFESQNGIPVVQISRVKLGGHGIRGITENSSFLNCIADQDKNHGGCGITSDVVSARILLNGHDLLCVVPVRCLIFRP